VGPYGVVATCEALDAAGFESVPKQRSSERSFIHDWNALLVIE
jgi:hypothetical protein